jgi:uncharacterized protein (TIGR03437 family)
MDVYPASHFLRQYQKGLSFFAVLAVVLLTIASTIRFRAFAQGTPKVITVSAASYDATVAPGAIVAAYAANLATVTLFGVDVDPNQPGVQLPTELGGTTIEVNGVRAEMFYVSPSQVNYVIPAGIAPGTANVVARSGDGTISAGTVTIAQVAPAIFSANANGQGAPAATLLRVKANGQQSFESISEFDPINNKHVAKSIDMGPDGEHVFAILFLTGIKKAQDDNGDGNLNERIRVSMGSETLTPSFAGAAPGFVGLEQINVEIPRTLIGRGIVRISVEALGYQISNLVDINVAAAIGRPPQISGFDTPNALAGQELSINGGGFAEAEDDNTVRIAGSEAGVMNASPNKLKVSVPLGVETGMVSVATPQGENFSPTVLPIRTSISGFVEDTSRRPLRDVAVRVSGEGIEARTNQEGVFVLPDVPTGTQIVEVDGNSVQVNPPFPKVVLKIPTAGNRDNNIARPVSLQQSTGSSGFIGSGASGSSLIAGDALSAQDQIVIETDGFQLAVPSDSAVTFPGGATGGRITVTPLLDGRTPAPLPRGFYSASVVQITPFNVEIAAGATLTFPNSEALPPGTPVDVFRYDSKLGAFVAEPDLGTVTPDGKSIVSAPGSIKLTNFYFAAVSQQTTTVKGRVLELSGKPVPKALVSVRGQEAYTDGTGTYVLRSVTAKEGETLFAEVSFARLASRLERVLSPSAKAVLGGVTLIPDTILGAKTANRPPSIVAPTKLELEAGLIYEVKVAVSDPDEGQTVTLNASTSIPGLVIISGGERGVYLLRFVPLLPNVGTQILTLTATDNLGASTKLDVALSIRGGNRAPAAASQTVTINQDTPTKFVLSGKDPDGDPIRFQLLTKPSFGELSGSAPNLAYTPGRGYTGRDAFTFLVTDGKLQSAPATVTIVVGAVK